MDTKKPAILSISLLIIVTNAAMAPMLGLISQSFPEAGPTMIKQVMTIPSLMIIIFSIISGQLVKYLPKKTILALGLSIYLIGAFFAASAKSIGSLILLRALMGAGAGLFIPLASSLITDFYSGEERAKMVGYSSFASYAGAALGPLLTGWIARERWQNAFYIYLAAFFVLIVTMLFIPNKPANKPVKGENQKTKFGWAVIKMALLACFIYTVYYLVPTDVSFLVRKLQTPNPSHAAILLALEVSSAAIAGVLFSHFTRKLNIRAFPLGFGSMAIGFSILFFASSLPQLILGMIFSGFGMGTLRPLVVYRTSQVAESGSMTSAFALVNSGFSLGQFISPFFYYSVYQIMRGDIISANYLSGAFILLAAIIISLILAFSKKSHAV
jgi:MFS family permease